MAISRTFPLYLSAQTPSNPLLVDASSDTKAGNMVLTQGDKFTLRVYFVDTTGASPVYVVPSGTDTVIMAVKKTPSDASLVFLVNTWSYQTSYIEATFDGAVASDFWLNASQTSRALTCDIEVRNAGSSERVADQFPIVIRRRVYGGETAPGTITPYLDTAAALGIFVAYDRSQSLTSPQKLQAVQNLGGTTFTNDLLPLTTAALYASAIGLGTASNVTHATLTTSGNLTIGTGTAKWAFTTTTLTQSNSSGVQVLRTLSTGKVISHGGFEAGNNETNQNIKSTSFLLTGSDEENTTTFSVNSTTGNAMFLGTVEGRGGVTVGLNSTGNSRFVITPTAFDLFDENNTSLFSVDGAGNVVTNTITSNNAITCYSSVTGYTGLVSGVNGTGNARILINTDSISQINASDAVVFSVGIGGDVFSDAEIRSNVKLTAGNDSTGVSRTYILPDQIVMKNTGDVTVFSVDSEGNSLGTSVSANSQNGFIVYSQGGQEVARFGQDDTADMEMPDGGRILVGTQASGHTRSTLDANSMTVTNASEEVIFSYDANGDLTTAGNAHVKGHIKVGYDSLTGHLHLKQGSSDPGHIANNVTLFPALSGNGFGFKSSVNNIAKVTATNTAERTYTLPDNSGGVALEDGTLTAGNANKLLCAAGLGKMTIAGQLAKAFMIRGIEPYEFSLGETSTTTRFTTSVSHLATIANSRGWLTFTLPATAGAATTLQPINGSASVFPQPKYNHPAYGLNLSAPMMVEIDVLFSTISSTAELYFYLSDQTLFTASCTYNGTTTVTTADTTNLRVGHTIGGTGTPSTCYIVSITNSTTFEINTNATASGTATWTFYGTPGGQITNKGFGWKLKLDGTIRLETHNGTAATAGSFFATTVNTTYTAHTTLASKILMVSDGTTIYLYVNEVFITSMACPSGVSLSAGNTSRFTVYSLNFRNPAAGAAVANTSNPRIYY